MPESRWLGGLPMSQGTDMPAKRLSEVDHLPEDRGYGTPCWIWQRSIDKKGYARIHDPATGNSMGAYRFVYEAHVGPVPLGLSLDHLCRVPACVNPEHLEPVTHAENLRRGSHVKLDWEAVEEIRNANPVDRRALSEKFGVSVSAIAHVRAGRSWATSSARGGSSGR